MSQHATTNGSAASPPPEEAEVCDESSPPDLKDERFAPFARFDAYGDMGVAPQPPGERIYRALATILLLPPRVVIAIFSLVATWSLCKLDALVPASMRPQFVAFWGKLWVRACLFGLGFVWVQWVKVQPEDGKEDAPPAKACAIVSNHCSWLDIMVHMSHFFPSFVAREGTQNIPLVGLVSQKIQCFFVNREAGGQGTSTLVKERIVNKAKHIDSTAEYPMLLFPEGTTTNGRYLLPFKKGAFLAGVPVQPVVLKYHMWKVNMCWDTIPIKRHIFLMLTEPWNRVTCYELPVYVPSEAEKADPELYASNVREAMLKFGGFKPSDSNLDTKKIYHRAIGYTKPPKPKAGTKVTPGDETPTVHAKVA